MTGPISAQVRRILKGHSDRALVHAVDDAGLEYKIEVPLEAVRAVDLEAGQILVISWSLQAASPSRSAPTPPRQATIQSPNEVDRAFMELMSAPRGSPSSATTAPTGPSSTSSTRAASLGLAEVFGVKASHESRST